jgi:hypothetical protein
LWPFSLDFEHAQFKAGRRKCTRVYVDILGAKILINKAGVNSSFPPLLPPSLIRFSIESRGTMAPKLQLPKTLDAAIKVGYQDIMSMSYFIVKPKVGRPRKKKTLLTPKEMEEATADAFFKRRRVGALKEEGDSSHVNQAYDND